MSKWLSPKGLSVTFAVISAAALGYFNFVYAPAAPHNLIQLPAVHHCAINQQVCEVELAPNQIITFSVTPFHAKAMTTLTLNLSGKDIQQAVVHIDGVNMNMPGFPIKLIADSSKNNYHSETALAVCSLSAMHWRASLTLTIADQSYLIPFLFTTHS